MTRAGRLLSALVAALVLAGCSTVPSSSPTVQITQEPARAVEDVGIEPLEPEPGATPEEIVRDFIDAAASTARGHPVARDYLTPEARDAWSDQTGITVIAAGYATVTSPTNAGLVTMTADLVGTVEHAVSSASRAPAASSRLRLRLMTSPPADAERSGATAAASS